MTIMQNNILHSSTLADQESEAFSFIEKLARALHRFGVPSYRIEDALAVAARRFDIQGQFFATPTAVFASLDGTHATKTLLVRLDPGEVNLEKLSHLDALLARVTSGHLNANDASRQIDRIVDAPTTYRMSLTLMGFSVASAAAARFFGGGWREIAICAVIGLASGFLAAMAGRFPGRLRVFEPLAAFAAGFLAVAAASALTPTSVYVATCAGLIVLLPGLTLTIGINEIATRHLAAGTVRLAGALMLFVQIGFGVAVGLKAGAFAFGAAATVAPQPLPGWTLGAALLLAPMAFAVLFQASLRDVGWIAAASTVAFFGARAGSVALGAEMGAFTGALLVGIASNLHARILDRPASVTLVPGIMMLVPGSVGFQSLSSLIARDVVSGLQTALTMTLVGVAIVTGLLLAGGLVPPRRSL